MAATKTRSRSKTAPYIFDDKTKITAGRSKQIDVRLARMPSGTWATMPVVVVHGAKPGPTMWISGAIHGDELNGIEIVRQVLARTKPKQLRGTLIAVPIVNVFGVTLGSRYLPDRRDLNRSFPGSLRGSLAARIAKLFIKHVVERSDLGIDFHTGSNGRDNLPQIRCDLQNDKTRELAEAFGPPVLLQAKGRQGSLRATAHKQGKPVLLYEGGEAERFDDRVIDTGVAGALRVMQSQEMIDEAPPPADEEPFVCATSRWERASRSGFCRLACELDEEVEAGQTVARIADSTSSRSTHVRARRGGVVIAVLRTGIAHRGDAVVHIAEGA